MSDIVYETCDAIWEILQPIYLCVPSNHQEWQRIADKYVYYIVSRHCFMSNSKAIKSCVRDEG